VLNGEISITVYINAEYKYTELCVHFYDSGYEIDSADFYKNTNIGKNKI